ncbi:hypothetical protein E2C01_079223 [Portunus trituberculatus]|uniref:Uncharacterized protein n=1 Tax=Portunus trituberculatus TaxID=210409 RepID=A0A5B7IWB4_PORTR|nr:hypothetical protein [Portunus trituberculatus]
MPASRPTAKHNTGVALAGTVTHVAATVGRPTWQFDVNKAWSRVCPERRAGRHLAAN